MVKKTVIITLDEVLLESRHSQRTQKHILTVSLVWPRTGVARKSTVLTIPMINGHCLTDLWSWTNKICFKETVETPFGIGVSLSEPMSSTNLRKFMRFMVGKTAAVAADHIEHTVPTPYLDDIAALPMLYVSKQLLGSEDPALIAEGVYDLPTLPETIPESQPLHVSVPLVAPKTTRTVVGDMLAKKYTQDGFARFSIFELA